jgi:hypothetical protein
MGIQEDIAALLDLPLGNKGELSYDVLRGIQRRGWAGIRESSYCSNAPLLFSSQQVQVTAIPERYFGGLCSVFWTRRV